MTPRDGRPFTIEEHYFLNQWNRNTAASWPRIEMALNYPDTPEMFGVIEKNQIGPTIFLWANDNNTILEPYAGDQYVFADLQSALSALSIWAGLIINNKRISFNKLMLSISK